mmetsp:Transcript_18019/g.32264  ORF Transcript_18019/g.32264 Transcript_18019/m.32264 type:complete len:781 (+) Transcript_18019:131-2473(+)
MGGSASSENVPPWLELDCSYSKHTIQAIQDLAENSKTFVRQHPYYEGKFSLGVDQDQATELATACMAHDPRLAAWFPKLVPKHVHEDTFWSNYFSHVEYLIGVDMGEIKPERASTIAQNGIAQNAITQNAITQNGSRTHTNHTTHTATTTRSRRQHQHQHQHQHQQQHQQQHGHDDPATNSPIHATPTRNNVSGGARGGAGGGGAELLRLTFTKRPFGIELARHQGRSVYPVVHTVEHKTRQRGLSPGHVLVQVNDVSVAEEPLEDLLVRLKTAPLPMALSFHLPTSQTPTPQTHRARGATSMPDFDLPHNANSDQDTTSTTTNNNNYYMHADYNNEAVYNNEAAAPIASTTLRGSSSSSSSTGTMRHQQHQQTIANRPSHAKGGGGGAGSSATTTPSPSTTYDQKKKKIMIKKKKAAKGDGAVAYWEAGIEYSVKLPEDTILSTKQIRDPVRWGVVGCGEVCRASSAAALSCCKGSELEAAMRRDRRQAFAFAKHFQCKATTSAQDLIHDPHVSAIYIATPPGPRLALALLACKALKPCLLETPIARSYHEARAIRDAFAAAGVPLFVASQVRCDQSVRAVKLVLKQKRLLGTITSVTYKLSRRAFAVVPAGDGGWRDNPEIAGGGLFLEHGAVVLDLIEFLLGPISRASGDAVRRAGVNQGSAETCVTMTFRAGGSMGGRGRSGEDAESDDSGLVVGSGGAPGCCVFNFASAVKEDLLVIDGTNGRLEMPVFNKKTNPVLTNQQLCGSGSESGSICVWVWVCVLNNYELHHPPFVCIH